MGSGPIDPWARASPEPLRRPRRLLRDRPRARALAIALLATSAYAVATLTVVGLEYRSEVEKLSRGAFTDTFPPLMFSQLVSAPLGLASSVHYPDGPFDESAYRAVVHVGVHHCLVAIGLQAGALAVVVAGVGPPAAGRRRGLRRAVRSAEGEPEGL